MILIGHKAIAEYLHISERTSQREWKRNKFKGKAIKVGKLIRLNTEDLWTK